MSALVLIENLTPVAAFSDNNLDPLIEKIEQEVTSEVYDVTTEEGRKRIASVAYKIAKAKNTLDKLGKNLTEEWQRQTQAVNAERRRVWDRLELLQDKVRLPLTEYENREKQRIAAHEERLAKWENCGKEIANNWQTEDITIIEAQIAIIEHDETDWQEFRAKASVMKAQTHKWLSEALEKRRKHDAEQAELIRLRKEAAEREQKEREERIAREAAEQARVAAEKKAKEEANRLKEIEEEKLRKAKEAAEKAKAEKEAAQKKAEKEKQARLEAEQKAKEEKAARLAAEKKAHEEKLAREQEEKLRKEQQVREAKEREEMLAARKNQLRNAATRELSSHIGHDAAERVIELIERNKIPHVAVEWL
jgi:hypothetical protein